MAKKTLLLIFTFLSILGYPQTSLEIDSELLIDDYKSMSVFKTMELNDSIILLAARIEISQTDQNKLAIYRIKGDQIVSKTIIKPNVYINYKDIVPLENGIIIIGSIFVEGDQEQDYIGFFNKNGEYKWNLKLEKKYEGIIHTKKTLSELIVLTSGNQGLYRYKVNFDGKILSKNHLPINNYFINAYVTRDENILITSVLLNEEGETEKWNLHLFDSKLKLIKHTSPGFPDSFFPKEIIESENGFLIAGNLDRKNIAPQSYTIDHELELFNATTYHYQPSHYKFKSDFQLNDICIGNSKEIYIASGVTKVVNDETNIIFLIDEYSLLNYKLLDQSGGIWKNSNVILKSNNHIVLVGDIKKTDGFNTCIKKIEIK